MTVRVRFAPSPTGMLHIGGARTALFNYLFARHHGGRFVLRIEDTDKARNTQESVDAILHGMEWLGLEYDEGPFYQSQRGALYEATLTRLRERGCAYQCVCTPERLAAMREAQKAAGGRQMYDGTCRDRAYHPKLKEGFVWRFRSPREGRTQFEDLIRGVIGVENTELDDLVLARSDGSPTYNFVVVADDIDMGITHVIRGDDHINNTPRQIQIYEALGHKPPRFAHLPLILNQQRKPYSKRDGAVSVTEFRDQGYLPHAMMNYLARLGWAHGDQEIFTEEELIEKFTLEAVNKAGAVFDFTKLQWLNGHYIRESSIEWLVRLISPRLQEAGCEGAEDDARLHRITGMVRERSKLVTEIINGAKPFYGHGIERDAAAAAKFLTQDVRPALTALRDRLMNLGEFNQAGIEESFTATLGQFSLKMVKLAQPVRVALMGVPVSPGIYEVIEVLGRDEAMYRLNDAIAVIPLA